MNINKKHSIYYVAIIVLIIKTLISIFWNGDLGSAEDWSIGINLLKNGTYSLYDSTNPTALKTPVYPVFIYSIISIFGISKLAVVLVQHFLSVLSGILLYKLTRLKFSEETSQIIGILLIVHPSYLYYSSVIEVTNIFVPLIILSVLLFGKLLIGIKEKRNLNIVFTSIILAITGLCQPIVLPIMLIAFIYLVGRKRYREVVKMSVIMLITISPWLIRNYSEFGKIIPTKTPFWMNFYIGYLESSHGEKEFDIIDDTTKIRIREEWEKSFDDIKMEKEYKSIVLSKIAENPKLYIAKTIKQAGLFWTYPPRYSSNNSISFEVFRKLPVYILNILLIVSLYYCYKTDKSIFYSIISVLAFFTAVYSLSSTANIRYKLDIEWLQIFLLAYPIESIIRKKSISTKPE